MAETTIGFFVGAPWGGVIFTETEDLDITSTNIIQKPVDFVMGGDVNERGRASQMSKAMMRNIFRE